MKFIAKVKVRVYEAEGDMDDAIASEVRSTHEFKDRADAVSFGKALAEAVRTDFVARTLKQKNEKA